MMKEIPAMTGLSPETMPKPAATWLPEDGTVPVMFTGLPCVKADCVLMVDRIERQSDAGGLMTYDRDGRPLQKDDAVYRARVACRTCGRIWSRQAAAGQPVVWGQIGGPVIKP